MNTFVIAFLKQKSYVRLMRGKNSWVLQAEIRQDFSVPGVQSM